MTTKDRELLVKAAEVIKDAADCLSSSVQLVQFSFDSPPEPATELDHEFAQNAGRLQTLLAEISEHLSQANADEAAKGE